MPAAEPWSSTLVCRFVADVLERTLDIADDAAYQRALQAFVDDVVFPRLLHCSLSSDAEMMDLGPRGMYPYYPALDDFWVQEPCTG
jgi:hypothetical protein